MAHVLLPFFIVNVIVISHLFNAWRVYRLGQEDTQVAAGFDNGDDAMTAAMQAAQEHRPSRMLMIKPNGESRTIATF